MTAVSLHYNCTESTVKTGQAAAFLLWCLLQDQSKSGCIPQGALWYQQNTITRTLLLFLRIEMFNLKDYSQYKLYCQLINC